MVVRAKGSTPRRAEAKMIVMTRGFSKNKTVLERLIAVENGDQKAPRERMG